MASSTVKHAAIVVVAIALVALALWSLPARLFENHDYINCVNTQSGTEDFCAKQFGKYIWSVTFK